MEFRKAFEIFLTSVRDKDWKTFITFFNAEKDFFAILPKGDRYFSVAAFLKSQRPWFKEEEPFGGAVFDYLIQEAKEMGDYGFGTLFGDVKLKDGAQRIKVFVSFIFARQNQSWVLIFDQNTLIP